MAASSKEAKIKELKKNLSELQEKLEELEERPRKVQIKELHSWVSPSRIYKKKSARWFLNLVLLISIILVILLFLKEFILMAVVLSFAFLTYVISAVAPENVEHKITTQGITSGDQSFLWEELYDFWFTSKGGFRILVLDTLLRYPRQVFILIPQEEEEKIKSKIVGYLPFREVPGATWMDRWGDKLSHQFHHLVGS
ncbi:MAG: hypothetical protein Q8P13_00570 [bacterium]|nr:hypothetical protein [bacterium]